MFKLPYEYSEFLKKKKPIVVGLFIFFIIAIPLCLYLICNCLTILYCCCCCGCKYLCKCICSCIRNCLCFSCSKNNKYERLKKKEIEMINKSKKDTWWTREYAENNV